MLLPIGALLENDIWHFVEVADDDLRIVHTVAVEFLLVYVSAVVFDADGGPLHAVGPEEIFGGVVADVVKLSGLRKFFCDDVESSAVGLFGADFFGDGDVFVENKAVETEGFDFVSLSDAAAVGDEAEHGIFAGEVLECEFGGAAERNIGLVSAIDGYQSVDVDGTAYGFDKGIEGVVVSLKCLLHNLERTIEAVFGFHVGIYGAIA